MNAYDKVMAARDSKRLTAFDYINKFICSSFIEMIVYR